MGGKENTVYVNERKEKQFRRNLAVSLIKAELWFQLELAQTEVGWVGYSLEDCTSCSLRIL